MHTIPGDGDGTCILKDFRMPFDWWQIFCEVEVTRLSTRSALLLRTVDATEYNRMKGAN